MKHLFSVTKSFDRMPRAHAQFQDICEDGSPGSCASLHGYDLKVSIEVSAKELDRYGWVYPFGHFKDIRNFLEYYCDHTSSISAEDPRRDKTIEDVATGMSLVQTIRVMPYGVSMEMMSLFLLEQAAGYIYKTSEGRCAITKIEFREHDNNQGQVILDFDKSLEIGKRLQDEKQLVQKSVWDFELPSDAIKRIIGE